jgi:hypothetical protein
VAHTYIATQEKDNDLKPAWASSSQDPISKNPSKKKKKECPQHKGHIWQAHS